MGRGGDSRVIMAGRMKNINGYVSTSTHLMLFMVLFIYFPLTSHQSTGTKHLIIDLQDGEEHVMSGSNRFCYRNTVVPTWRQTWTRIQVKVWSSNVFKVDTVEGEEELQELERFTLWGWFQSLLRERHNETTINISLFSKKTCFKVDPAEKSQYTVKPVRKFDIYLFLVFLSGILLFVFADSLSRSSVFFYSAGMSTGMIASLIILFFILARFLPKKSPFYVLIVGGWSFSLYAIQLVCRNLSIILREHWHVALGLQASAFFSPTMTIVTVTKLFKLKGLIRPQDTPGKKKNLYHRVHLQTILISGTCYVSVVGFISFAACYRYGPLVDERSINIVSWTLQLFGLLLIYLGIQIQQVAFAIIVAAVLSKNLEYPVLLAVAAWRKFRRYFFWKPEPRRLLTEEEYQKEAEEETRRALDELRKYCNSPEFSPWKAVSRLQSPKRFADFIEGSTHLMQNEVSVHAQEYGFGGSFFEDEFFDTDDEEDDIKPPNDPE